jgi:hypothetical protein
LRLLIRNLVTRKNPRPPMNPRLKNLLKKMPRMKLKILRTLMRGLKQHWPTVTTKKSKRPKKKRRTIPFLTS